MTNSSRDKSGRFANKGPNDHYIDTQGDVHIVLTQGREAIVSSEDYPKVANFWWYAQRVKSQHQETFYACTVTGGALKMHVLISAPGPGLEVDHWDGDGLNNRRLNLRNVTHRVNMQNMHQRKTSDHPGVSWYRSKKTEKWRAQIKILGKTKHLGLFSDELEAAAAYRNACLLYTGAACVLAEAQPCSQ